MTTSATPAPTSCDVGAALLSLGEPFSERALASLKSQVPAIHDVVVVRDVAPFSRALNEAARRVQSPYLLQVDADMTLDAGCVSRLRSAMGADTALVHAALRDPLRGAITGIKLFRTECLRSMPFPDSISPDTDFARAAEARGWRVHGIEESLGEHRPDYSPEYCLRKFMLEGARLRYRGARTGLREALTTLAESLHPQAALAMIALGHGFFQPWMHDGLRPLQPDPRAARLASFLGHASGSESSFTQGAAPFTGRLRDAFLAHLEMGTALARDPLGFASHLHRVRANIRDASGSVALLGLAHGLLGAWTPAEHAHDAERQLARFVTHGLHASAPLSRRVRANAVALARRVLPRQDARSW